MEGGDRYPDIEGTMLNYGPDFDTFHYFSKFPQELQDIIWLYCCNIPRRVEVISGEQKLTFVSNTPRIPLVLQTCRAARRIGLRMYLELSTSKKIYFNPKVDVICFGWSCFDGISTIKWLAKNTYVRYIECRLELWRIWAYKWASRFFNALRQLDNLREITFFYEALGPDEMLGQIIKERFEETARIHKGWRLPDVKFTKRTRDNYCHGGNGVYPRVGNDGPNSLSIDE